LLGEALDTPSTGYSVVYHIEIYLLFATLIALGPLVRGTLAGNWQAASSNPLRLAR
jgi:BCD family chlorophyll transporter-like MFS transporter